MGTGKPHTRVFEFRSLLSIERVDRESGVIRGVSLISKGDARGHDLEVDDTTLRQIFDCATAKGRVPVKANHKSGVGDITGYLENFSLENGNVRGDWHLLKSYPMREQFLETAERMPGGVGLSVAFVGPEKPIVEAGHAKARCEELLSVDYVAMPAANPNGLFERQVDNAKRGMDAPANSPAEPTLRDIANLLGTLTERIGKIEQGHTELRQEMQLAANPPSLGEILEMTPEQLAAIGLTEEDVQARIEQLVQEGVLQIDAEGNLIDPNAEQAPQVDADGNPIAAQPGTPVGNPAQSAAPGAPAQAAPAAAATASALSRIERKVTEMEARYKDAQRHEFLAGIARDFDAVAQKIDELTAENTTLKAANKAAGTAVKRGSDGKPILFSRDGAADKRGSFENKVIEFEAAGKKRSEAFRLAIKDDPDGYRKYQEALGTIEKTA